MKNVKHPNPKRNNDKRSMFPVLEEESFPVRFGNAEIISDCLSNSSKDGLAWKTIESRLYE